MTKTATMKKKIDVDMPAYRILGACNPQMAWQAIGMEPRVGAMLPCNVILRAVDGGVEVSAVDPVASNKRLITNRCMQWRRRSAIFLLGRSRQFEVCRRRPARPKPRKRASWAVIRERH